MFRESAADNAMFVSLSITPGGTAKWDVRSANSAMASSTSAGSGTAPYWVKLAREGSRFTGYISSNGTTWAQVAQVNLDLSATPLVGLAQSSSAYGGTNISTYANVAVTRTDHTLPSGWGDQGVGTAAGFAGNARFYNDTFTFAVESSGQDVGYTADAFHFAHRTLVGDGEMVARVVDMAGQSGGAVYQYAKAGVMFRDGTGANARNVFMAISGSNGAVWQNRSTAGADTSMTWSAGKAAPYYVKITRVGNTFTGYASANGATWTAVGSPVTIGGMSASLEVGLGLSAAGYGNLNTTSFDHVKLTPAVPTLSATLVHAGRIDLSWTDNSGSETGFVLQRSEDNGATWTTLGDGGEIHASGYADLTVDASKTYKYRVKSFIDDVVRGETDWSAPPVSATTTGLGNGLAGTFYDNLDFTGATATRTDQAMNLLWADGASPIAGVAADTFTSQWTGQIFAPATGTYTFKALSDDGARVWINNQLVLNDWDVHSPSTRGRQVDLVANNKYDVKVEYFQHYGAAQIGLSWVVPGAGTGTNAVSIPTANLYSQSPNQPPAAPASPTGVR